MCLKSKGAVVGRKLLEYHILMNIGPSSQESYSLDKISRKYDRDWIRLCDISCHNSKRRSCPFDGPEQICV